MVKQKAVSSLAALCICTLLTLLLVFENRASSAAKEALDLSINSVLPPLFPYMVFSSVIISLDLLAPIYSFLPTEKLFGLPKVSAQVILCGMICGFPIGALGAQRLYSNGSITKSQAARLWAISSHTSPSFLIGAVSGWWQCRLFGVFLYVMQIVFAFLAGYFLFRGREPVEGSISPVNQTKASVMEVVCRAISESSLSCLAVTGYIVFFRVLSVIASSVIPALSPLFMTVFEFSTGAFFGSSVGGAVGAAVTGFAVGFSGLAVFMQCVNFTEKERINAKYYLGFKLAEGAFLAAASAIFAMIIPLSPTSSAFSPIVSTNFSKEIFVILSLLLTFFTSTYPRKRN